MNALNQYVAEESSTDIEVMELPLALYLTRSDDS